MNLFGPLWFIWKGNDGYGGGRDYSQIKIFYFFVSKNTGKMARAQGKHREFGINWSVATLSHLDGTFQHCYKCFWSNAVSSW